MALHNLAFVIDIEHEDNEAGDCLDVKNHFIKRGILQILLHFGYKHGFDKVRWGYKFFQSKTGRNTSFMSRVSDFKELRHKSFEDFEQEFDSKLDTKNNAFTSHRRQQCNQSILFQNALKETLLDFQWDRPDITSPTKLSLRSRKLSGKKTNLSLEEDISINGRNLVFIVSKCPQSWTQLSGYLSLGDHNISPDVTESIISTSLKDMLLQRQVILHWIDTSSHSQVMRCEDHLGSDKLSEILSQLGGSVFPLVALLNFCYNDKSNLAFIFQSSIGFIVSSQKLYRMVFPAVGGVLKWKQGNVTLKCGVTMEPISRRQKLVQEPVEVCLKGVLQGWDVSSQTRISTESWVLQSSSGDEEAAFQHLLMELSAHGLQMFAEVSDDGLLYSAIFSPQSHSTALLSLIRPVLTENVVPVMSETSSDLPDVVNSVLGVVYDMMKQDGNDNNDKLDDCPIPEWAQQELGHSPVTTNILETWFPQSDHAGVSSHLMESLRLLQAVPEKSKDEELSDLNQDLISDLSGLYKMSQESINKKNKKRGANRTPVKQKMKTMSRSLQMLNVARLNVKAQKNQTEAEEPVTEKFFKRRLGQRSKQSEAKTINFSTEAELLTYLNNSYQQILTERNSSLIAGVLKLLSAIKAFHLNDSDSEVEASSFAQQHLLKTGKSIRQHYGVSDDADSKVRECKLQVLLRLEMCKAFTSKQSDGVDVDQMAEEAAEMLRIISLTKDPVCLTRFLQDEVLSGFLTAVPTVLADIYHSLGTQLPEALLAVLPADFFSDESVVKDSVSPSGSSSSISIHSLVSNGLQDLRKRSPCKRRSGVLTRHRSMTESSQSLRQIQIPKKASKPSKSTTSTALEKVAAKSQPQKQETQEVTKVRRNLFNQELVSPSKKAKLPRSQSVSAVEGLKRKRSGEAEGRHKLLTKTVCETPLHKQVSNRLLHRQKMRRRSNVSEDYIVEESPTKSPDDLRRSPRIKSLARRTSNSFYSGSHPLSRNLDKTLSSSQLSLSDDKLSEVSFKSVHSPMRLLFGAAESSVCPSEMEGITTRSRLSTDSSVFESPNKTSAKSPNQQESSIFGTPSPRTRSPQTPKTPPSSKMRISCVAESPVASGSGLGRSLQSSVFVIETPTKQNPGKSPLKGILRTPIKVSGEVCSSSELCLLSSPESRTPKKSVTWSPTPVKYFIMENNASFKVPESPRNKTRFSPRLSKMHDKIDGPIQSTKTKIDLFQTQEKVCQVNLMRISDQTSQILEKNQTLPENQNKTPPVEKRKASNVVEIVSQLPDQQISPVSSSRSQAKSPSPTHRMITRSGRSPRQTFDISAADPACPHPEGFYRCFEVHLVESESEPKSAVCDEGERAPDANFQSQFNETFGSELRTAKESVEDLQSHTKEKLQTESSQSFDSDSSPTRESQAFDSSVTTDSDSLDIIDAAVVKNDYNEDGIKMNIAYSRRPSKSDADPQSGSITPKHVPYQSTPSRCYGFRQTPDRQQREAAARLGYGNDAPRLSRAKAVPLGPKGFGSPNVLTYQVELDMPAQGMPKLKIKRANSPPESPAVSVKPNLESPLSLYPKHRDPGCVSPSVCPHVTPAKSTPGKGGCVQTYICQSYTPTRLPAATMSPMAIADLIPLTPSPQSVGKMTPENLNSWPRRKKAQMEMSGVKDRLLKEQLLEEAELGVSRLQDFEEADEPSSNKVEKTAASLKQSSSARADPLSPMEDLYWIEKLAEQTNSELLTSQEEFQPTGTSPNTNIQKTVTPSGIFALTQSPLLYKTKTRSANKKTSNLKGEEAPEVDGPVITPFRQPSTRSNTGRTYSRKRLID